MKAFKIDKRILKEIEILDTAHKIPCFVFGRNLQATKNQLKQNDIHILDEYLFINSFYCLASKKEIMALSDFEFVDYISSLSHVDSLMYLSKKILSVEKSKLFGKGIGVAFIDTGINPHCDFMIGKDRVAFFKDFVNNKNQCYDDNGHGTFVAGVCAGSGVLSGFKYSGIAPKADIFSLKALNGQGEASANKILDAMEWIFDNHKKHNIKVVCMSFGSEPLGVNDPIMLGAEALWKSGVVVVAAAGNSGPEFQTIKSPGISPYIITVGGIDDNRYGKTNYDKQFFEMAEFSSRGPALKNVKPDMVAPSVDIISCGVNNFYTTLSGTSVATPMIAGLCCLMLEKNNSLSPLQVKKELIKTCRPLGFELNSEGYGMPNFSSFNF